jgi:hypothetical protein
VGLICSLIRVSMVVIGNRLHRRRGRRSARGTWSEVCRGGDRLDLGHGESGQSRTSVCLPSSAFSPARMSCRPSRWASAGVSLKPAERAERRPSSVSSWISMVTTSAQVKTDRLGSTSVSQKPWSSVSYSNRKLSTSSSSASQSTSEFDGEMKLEI